VPYTSDVPHAPVIRVVRHLLFGLGLIAAIAVWFIETPDPSSRIGRFVAPRYLPALNGYRQLTKDALIHSHDEGFADLLELADTEIPQTTRERIAVLRLQGMEFVPSGNAIYIEAFDADNRKIHGFTILNPATALKQRFSERDAQSAKWILSFFALVITTLMYVAEVLLGRRDHAARMRQEEELSRLRAQQDPQVILREVKREAERQERRGGATSPFRG
jgi:hypothetical protein